MTALTREEEPTPASPILGTPSLAGPALEGSPELPIFARPRQGRKAIPSTD